MKAAWLAVLLGTSAAVAAVPRAAGDPALAAILSRFEPGKPPIRFRYDVDYRFLFLNLLRLARAEVDCTEGWWRSRSGERRPAFLVEFRLDTLERPEASRRSRIAMHNTVLAVLSLPELDTLAYCKRTWEHINPLFGEKKEYDFAETYDFEGGGLVFRREDYLSGKVQTNLVGAAGNAVPGREIPVMLQRAGPVYHGRVPLKENEPSFRVTVNIDGKVSPFVVSGRWTTSPLAVGGRPMRALQAHIVGAPGSEHQGKSVDVWSASLEDVGRQLGDAAVQRAGREGPEWYIMPLAADYPLPLGYVRVLLSSVAVGRR